jgi:hypothetical protein
LWSFNGAWSGIGCGWIGVCVERQDNKKWGTIFIILNLKKEKTMKNIP